MYKQYKDTARVEIQDLQSIGMIAFLNAVQLFNSDNGFYSFWKSIACRDMSEEIKSNSIRLGSNGLFSDTCIGEENDLDMLVADGEDISHEINKGTITEQVIDILFDPQYKIHEKDAAIFLLYINGYSITEIAEQYNIKYASAWHRIKRIIHILRSILIKN